MTIDQIFVLIGGLSSISFVYWFFLLKQEEAAVTADTAIDIIVEGGYTPSTITVQKGKEVTLNFIRKDASSCLEEVTIPDFNIRKYLPMNEIVTVAITPHKLGQFFFSCGMNMYHGKLIVK